MQPLVQTRAVEKPRAVGVIADLIGNVVFKLVRVAYSALGTKLFFGALFWRGELDA